MHLDLFGLQYSYSNETFNGPRRRSSPARMCFGSKCLKK